MNEIYNTIYNMVKDKDSDSSTFVIINNTIASLNFNLGCLCGYVYVDVDNPYYGKTVDDFMFMDEVTSEEVTYAKEHVLASKTYWKIGFSQLLGSDPIKGISDLIERFGKKTESESVDVDNDTKLVLFKGKLIPLKMTNSSNFLSPKLVLLELDIEMENNTQVHAALRADGAIEYRISGIIEDKVSSDITGERITRKIEYGNVFENHNIIIFPDVCSSEVVSLKAKQELKEFLKVKLRKMIESDIESYLYCLKRNFCMSRCSGINTHLEIQKNSKNGKKYIKATCECGNIRYYSVPELPSPEEIKRIKDELDKKSEELMRRNEN